MQQRGVSVGGPPFLPYRLPHRLLVLGSLLLAVGWLSVGSARADNPAVVRLSFVDGNVQVAAGKAAASNPAVLNMPLFEGSLLTTAADGKAEVEFADGSVARLTPNSSLALTHLQPIGPSGHTELTLLSGLAYFELNVGQGQRFTVSLGPAALRPTENSIFRLSLDTAPEIAVTQGTLHVEGRGDGIGQDNSVDAGLDKSLDTDVTTNQYLRLDPASSAQYTLNQGIVADSWDQWNVDRDTAIAQMSASQTAVRDDSQAPQDPGWNDLDYYGNWYPVEGYGDVWAPSGVDTDWDPFGYGYWGNYSGYGTTWISGYPWGWLPYHCGAWNYFPFGWGWVPGGCGLGWSPVVTVWNTPAGYHLPGWPKGPATVPSQHRPPLGGTLIAVDRGPAARGPWNDKTNSGSVLLHNRGLTGPAARVQPLQVEGKVIQPLPRVSSPVAASPVTGLTGDRAGGNRGVHVGVPISANAYRSSRSAGASSAQGFGLSGERGNGTRNNVERTPGSVQSRPLGRSTYSPPAPVPVAPPRAAPRMPAQSPAGRPR